MTSTKTRAASKARTSKAVPVYHAVSGQVVAFALPLAEWLEAEAEIERDKRVAK